MESTIDDYFTISDNAGILEEKRLTGYNRDDIMFFVDRGYDGFGFLFFHNLLEFLISL